MATKREMVQVQEEIAGMYTRVCEGNHATPHRIMTSASTDDGEAGKEAGGGSGGNTNANATCQSLSKLKSGRSHFQDIDAVDPAAVQNKVLFGPLCFAATITIGTLFSRVNLPIGKDSSHQSIFYLLWKLK